MPEESLIVRGAREHNLRNIDVTIPRDRLTVITGLSGSGKSSLAFDTIYAEGQRRYVESLSAYARQFLGLMEKPDVDSIEGLSPAISIEQKSAGHNPRSTVGTVTEIYDYLRLLYARAGTPHCPNCGRPVERQSAGQIADSILTWPEADGCGGRRGEGVGQYGRTLRDVPQALGGNPRDLTGEEVREYGNHYRHDRVIRHQTAHGAVRLHRNDVDEISQHGHEALRMQVGRLSYQASALHGLFPPLGARLSLGA